MQETFTLRTRLRQIFSREFCPSVGKSHMSIPMRAHRFCECASSRKLMALLRFAELFYAGFVGFAAEQPPIDVEQPRGVACATTLLPQRNQVVLFKRNDEFAPVATVSVFLEGHTLDSFVQWGHSARSVCLSRIAASA